MVIQACRQSISGGELQSEEQPRLLGKYQMSLGFTAKACQKKKKITRGRDRSLMVKYLTIFKSVVSVSNTAGKGGYKAFRLKQLFQRKREALSARKMAI